MGNCKDCRYWESLCSDSAFGSCQVNKVDRAGTVYKSGSGKEITTCAEFGCVHFEQKPKGPFRVTRVAEPFGSGEVILYKIMFAGNCVDPGRRAGVSGKEATEELVDWLNDLWEKKECEWTGPVCSDCTRDKLERSHEYWKDCT